MAMNKVPARVQQAKKSTVPCMPHAAVSSGMSYRNETILNIAEDRAKHRVPTLMVSMESSQSTDISTMIAVLRILGGSISEMTRKGSVNRPHEAMNSMKENAAMGTQSKLDVSYWSTFM